MAKKYYVYVISTGETLHKVGVAESPLERLRVLQTGCPVLLTVSHEAEVARAEMYLVEGYAQYLLREACIRNEWFEASVEQVVAAIEAGIVAVRAGEKIPQASDTKRFVSYRPTEATYQKLREIVFKNHTTMQAIIDVAVEEYVARAAIAIVAE